jgi:hypothetical protein
VQKIFGYRTKGGSPQKDAKDTKSDGRKKKSLYRSMGGLRRVAAQPKARKNLPALVQQSVEQQRRKPKEYAPIGNICYPFEPDRSSIQ